MENLTGHLFLHQVHHRGRATTSIPQTGADPGDTGILEIIADDPA